MEEEREENNNNNSRKKSLIAIPSYEEVIQSSQPNPQQSLFTPSPSFSQAFSFIKNSDFYTPPRPPPPSTSSSQPDASTTPRQTPQSSEAPSSSLPSAGSIQVGKSILVSHRQKGNPLLKHIRNVKWIFADVVCDYVLGKTSCALYLSLRYHLLHPDYLYFRIRELPKNFKLRVVLCHVDVEDVVKPLLEVTRTAILHDCTLLCGWSLEECGRYLETIKVYENKPADLLQGQMDSDYLSRLNHALTTVRHVNKTDVVTLGSNFGSLSNIMDASMEDLARCPGIGERKVKRLYDAFHEPFRRSIPRKAAGVSETPTKKDNAESSIPSDKMEVEKSGDTKEPEDASNLNIKGALTAAFAKYSDKLRKKRPPPSEKDKETNATTSSEAQRVNKKKPPGKKDEETNATSSDKAPKKKPPGKEDEETNATCSEKAKKKLTY